MEKTTKTKAKRSNMFWAFWLGWAGSIIGLASSGMVTNVGSFISTLVLTAPLSFALMIPTTFIVSLFRGVDRDPYPRSRF